jgi:hypothetical protein
MRECVNREKECEIQFIYLIRSILTVNKTFKKWRNFDGNMPGLGNKVGIDGRHWVALVIILPVNIFIRHGEYKHKTICFASFCKIIFCEWQKCESAVLKSAKSTENMNPNSQIECISH